MISAALQFIGNLEGRCYTSDIKQLEIRIK
jgi:hypothetical protein